MQGWREYAKGPRVRDKIRRQTLVNTLVISASLRSLEHHFTEAGVQSLDEVGSVFVGFFYLQMVHVIKSEVRHGSMFASFSLAAEGVSSF
ncbi:MAG: hypothetical protein C5B49_14555 [Bdellovibrio sp.]|nr:MAG: hypothetical protein C5B49_14555 [Bdellovibrio sp.]